MLLVGPARAQLVSSADSSAWRPFQIGFSAAAFVTILEGPDAPERYQLYGRYRMMPRWTARAAVRYEQLFTDGQELDLGVRLGADYVLRDDGRLQLYAGVDAIGGYERQLNDNRTVRLGGAPLFGMLLYITDYLSLSVEPRLVATYRYFDKRGSFAADADEWAVELKGNGLLIVSIHF